VHSSQLTDILMLAYSTARTIPRNTSATNVDGDDEGDHEDGDHEDGGDEDTFANYGKA
jgi:hypothetical protein